MTRSACKARRISSSVSMTSLFGVFAPSAQKALRGSRGRRFDPLPLLVKLGSLILQRFQPVAHLAVLAGWMAQLFNFLRGQDEAFRLLLLNVPADDEEIGGQVIGILAQPDGVALRQCLDLEGELAGAIVAVGDDVNSPRIP